MEQTDDETPYVIFIFFIFDSNLSSWSSDDDVVMHTIDSSEIVDAVDDDDGDVSWNIVDSTRLTSE